MELYLTCKDLGDRYQILSASVQKPIPSVGFEIHKLYDTRTFTFIAENLLNNKPITFAKSDLPLVKEMLVIGEVDDLETHKQSQIYLCYSYFAEKTLNIPLYTFFEYQYLSNTFASKGIFISEENKEEKYLEILELNDNTLIDYLERYLLIQQTMLRYSYLYRELNDTITRIQDCVDKDSVTKIAKEYKAKGYSHINKAV